jgi:hypothetical protein
MLSSMPTLLLPRAPTSVIFGRHLPSEVWELPPSTAAPAEPRASLFLLDVREIESWGWDERDE